MLDGVLDRQGVDAVLNDLDEYAIEEALRIVESHGGNGEGGPHSITLISMGPERASEAIRKGLSMGADGAILISDPALAGSDALATSRVLAKVIADENFDLVICGTESTDARMAVIPAMLAQHLGWAQLTFANAISVDPATGIVLATRETEIGIEKMKAQLPVVISVVEKINEPRYPSFKGIMASKKKTIEIRSLDSLAIAQSEVGAGGSWSQVMQVTPKPARAQSGIKVVDEGSGGQALVNFLKEKKFI